MYDSTGPTVIEHLFYWLSSSLRVPGSFTPPEVGDADIWLGMNEHPARIIDLLPYHTEAAHALALLD